MSITISQVTYDSLRASGVRIRWMAQDAGAVRRMYTGLRRLCLSQWHLGESFERRRGHRRDTSHPMRLGSFCIGRYNTQASLRSETATTHHQKMSTIYVDAIIVLGSINVVAAIGYLGYIFR